MRAIWRRTLRISALLSSCPVALRNRRFSDSCFVARSSSTRAERSSSPSSLLVLAMSVRLLTGDDARLDGELLNGLLERDPGGRRVGVRQLEQDAARLHDGDPELGVALAGTHARLGRLLRHRLVREDVDPHLAAALDGAGHRDTGGLDLTCAEPARLERLDPVLTEGELGS